MSFFLSLHQYGDIGLLILRVAVGIIFLVHGKNKLPLWKAESAQAPMRNLLRFIGVAEILGGIAILTGFLTQLAALGLGIIMLGAMNMKIRTWKKSFAGDGGWEFDFILLAAAILLFFTGAGAYALDRLFWML
jgi:putative oxidoreductase